LLGIVVAFTPVTYFLEPKNFWPTAAPKVATLAVLALGVTTLARRGGSEGAGFVFLTLTSVSAVMLFEVSLMQASNHPFGFGPVLFFLGFMLFAPLRPELCLLLGALVVFYPWPFWWSDRIDVDPIFRALYTAFAVSAGIVGAVSARERRATLLARFRAEEALTERGEHLRNANEELKMARDAAQASDRAKSRFLSQVSHETRTPLSGILGFTELLEGRHFGELNERQATFLQHIRESGQHLLELINDLLDVTRLDTRAVDLALEEVSPAEVVLEVVRNVELPIREKGISIVNEVGADAPTLRVDRRRFRQSLYNLLSNALKFTPAGGGVGLRWRVEPGDWLCIEVWDQGIGIAAEELESIFDEFHQVDRKRDEALGGSGLGLALTRRLAELHGGQVRVESELGRGSSFFLVMPLASQQLALEAGPAPQQRHSETPDWHALAPAARVLVVDDNPLNLAVIQGLLEVRGIDPIVARSGQEAVAVVSRERPQLVLMDIQMPDCNGFEALAQIRAQESLAAIPIVAMTASASESDRSRYLAAGFNAFLPKPIDSVELDDQLERFLSPTAQA
jgi:signal transduction histidine kinase/ActR/RegA family two-component response regulator